MRRSPTCRLVSLNIPDVNRHTFSDPHTLGKQTNPISDRTRATESTGFRCPVLFPWCSPWRIRQQSSVLCIIKYNGLTSSIIVFGDGEENTYFFKGVLMGFDLAFWDAESSQTGSSVQVLKMRAA
jgi:hypothetical protein